MSLKDFIIRESMWLWHGQLAEFSDREVDRDTDSWCSALVVERVGDGARTFLFCSFLAHACILYCDTRQRLDQILGPYHRIPLDGSEQATWLELYPHAYPHFEQDWFMNAVG